MSDELRSELTALLNKHSREGESNTPDFILANFMFNALDSFEVAINAREEWYGRR